jgi:hypothetical protein
MTSFPKPPFETPKIDPPGNTAEVKPRPDHGETSYKGSGRLKGMSAIITGGDSGIGRAVAIAYAREGANVLISYLNEHEDAKDTARLVEEAGVKATTIAGDIQHAAHCQEIVEKAVDAFGKIDILVNNAAHQASIKELADISDEEWELTFREHPRDVLPLESCRSAHEGGQLDHQYGLDQFGRTKSDAARLCHHERRDP